MRCTFTPTSDQCDLNINSILEMMKNNKKIKMKKKNTKKENKIINLNGKHNRLLNNFRFIFRVSIKKG